MMRNSPQSAGGSKVRTARSLSVSRPTAKKKGRQAAIMVSQANRTKDQYSRRRARPSPSKYFWRMQRTK
ncbi:hypothetical protein D3C73_1660610 [compost metagenome]